MRRKHASSPVVEAIHRWWPRLLLLASSLYLYSLQTQQLGLRAAASSPAAAAAAAASAAAAAAAAAPAAARPAAALAAAAATAAAATASSAPLPARAGVCYENPLLSACREWRDGLLTGKRVDIVLVANELYQQFPLTGYGGIETSVENIASALHRMGIPFWVVTPGRSQRPRYPFDVLETRVAPNGRGGQAETFVEQTLALVRAREDATGANLSLVDAWHRALRSAPDGPGGPAARPLVVWGQSDWSQSFAAVGAVTITSHHDGGGPVGPLCCGKWDRHLPSVGHRFLSHDQRNQWIKPDDVHNLPRSRVIPHGLPPDDFMLCEDKGYFLWVAGLDWGWEEKGLHIFTELARMRPELRFGAYGVATKRRDLELRLADLAAVLPNFEFRGQLKRGAVHKRVFCEATAFFMPTQPSIGAWRVLGGTRRGARRPLPCPCAPLS